MFDVPVSSETDFSETASRPLASMLPASVPAASRPPDSRPPDAPPLDSPPPDSRPPDSRPLDSPPPDAGNKCPDALAAEITSLAGHLNAAHYRFLKLLDEFDRQQGWVGPGVRSLAHWLELKCGLGDLTAREKVRVARALRELPAIDAAFERGQISYSKVRAMTRAATPDNEQQLLNIARHGTAADMERLVRVYRRGRKPADASPGERAIRREQRFYCYHEDDETMAFGGRVAVEQGRLLLQALDAMVAEMERDAREAGSARTEKVSAETSAAASGEVVAAETSVTGSVASASSDSLAAGSGENVAAETSVAAPPQDVSAETPPFKPLREQHATALVHIAEHYLATRTTGTTALKSSDAYQVFVHVNANDAHPDNRINGAHTTHMDDRRCVAPHVARQLACDASRRTVLEDERGEVLNIGRRSRIVPWHIAHALRIRDGGCRFPGCNRRRWTDAHHIHHWADGGETSLDNLVTLCRYHHRALHRDEFRIEHGADGGLIFTDARHRPIPPAIHPQFGDRRGSGGVAETAGEWLQYADGVVF